MAATLRRTKKSEGKGTAGAIALVFFILASIGLGVWGYYGYQGQEQLREQAKAADNKKIAAESGEKYYQFLAWDFALALGHDLDGKTKTAYEKRRKEFFEHHAAADGAGEFKALGKPAVRDKEMVDTNDKNLKYDSAIIKYTLDTLGKIEELKGRIRDLENTSDAREKKLEDVTGRVKTLNTKLDTHWANLLDEVRKGNESAINEAKKMYEQMERALTENRELKDTIVKLTESHEEAVKKKEKEITLLNKALKEARAEGPVAGGAPAGGGPAREPHALVLDLSGYRPLWDRPLGEIVSLDLINRLVTIQPAKHVNRPFPVGMTFMVFARGADGGASGVLKGSLEIVRMLESSYVCRLTSFYDMDRGEIELSDPAKALGLRLARNAFKEGDLAFNMFFGSRVALAGVFDLNGTPGATPAEQQHQLTALINYLNRQGIEVDAYVDPGTGAMKGAITARTRFLIRGDDLAETALRVGEPKKEPGEVKEPKEPKEIKDGDGEKEMKKDGGDMPAPGERLAQIQATILRMRETAVNNGLFIISRSNFTTVIGHFPPRHFGESTRIPRGPYLPTAYTLAAPSSSFIARPDAKIEDFFGEWEGAGWEMTMDKTGSGKVSLALDRAGISEFRVVPAEVVKRDGKLYLSVAGPTPINLLASVSVGGTGIQLEDPAGKVPRLVLRKR